MSYLCHSNFFVQMQENIYSVYLKKGKEDSLRRFHPWVFSGAIQRMDEGIREGDIVSLMNAGRGGKQKILSGGYAAVNVINQDVKPLLKYFQSFNKVGVLIHGHI